tara:strand:- start:694 stop:1083 length:390 start_codon:yes stop_codon:yes gene_type:complete
MATLTPTLTLVSQDATTDDLSLTIADSLTVTAPYVGPSKLSVSTTGANNIICPEVDSVKYTYIKHTGVDASGSSITTLLKVEDTDNVQIAVLAAGEFMFFPHSKGAAKGVQLEAASGTIVAEYAYFTKG